MVESKKERENRYRAEHFQTALKLTMALHKLDNTDNNCIVCGKLNHDPDCAIVAAISALTKKCGPACCIIQALSGQSCGSALGTIPGATAGITLKSIRA